MSPLPQDANGRPIVKRRRATKLRLVPGAEAPTLVPELVSFISRYVVMTEAQTLVVALYVLHTHLCGVCEQTPYLSISSPERGCGKSRLMEVLELLVARPWMIVNPSEAVLFRKVSAEHPTLLWDEIDAVFSPKTAQYHENHRALLDQGHRAFGRVPRFIGDAIVEFSVFSPKVLAGIGALPDTIASRSIPIRLQRRKRSEPIRRFIRRDVAPEAEELRTRLDDWAEKVADTIEAARPEMPDELDDRMQEGCESLVAIGDVLGCGVKVREALVELLQVDRVDSQDTMRVRLLRDVKQICEERATGTAISTEDLLNELWNLPESQWGELRYYGRNLDEKDLAGMLSQYGVKPRLIKFKKGDSRRGYRLHDFTPINGPMIVGLQSAWERYASDATESGR